MRVKTDAKRDAILEVATAVFREQGYERTSMASISARLGGSKSTLYGYFKSKTELFVEVALYAGRRELAEPMEELTVPADRDLRRVLTDLGLRLVNFLCSEQALSLQRMVISEAGQSDIGQRFFDEGPRQGQLQLQRFLTEAMAAGLVRPACPGRAAHHFLGLLHSEAMMPSLYGLPPGPEELKALVGDAVEVFLRAYGPEAAPAVGTR